MLRKSLIVIWLGAVTVLAASVIVPNNASAAVQADSIGIVSGSSFYVSYEVSWNAYDCIESRLYLDGILKGSTDYGCYYEYRDDYGFLSDDLAASGRYVFQLWSSYYGSQLYSRSWILPTLAISAAATPSSISIGESAWISAKFTLSSNGADAYFGLGKITITAGNEMDENLLVYLYSQRYEAYYDQQPNPDFYSFSSGIPLAFGTSGTRTINVKFSDPLQSISAAPLSIEVRPRLSEIELQQEVAELKERLKKLQEDLDSSNTQTEDLQSKLNAAEAETEQLRSSFQSVPINLIYGSFLLGAVALALAIVLPRRGKPRMPPPYQGPPPNP